MPPSETGPRSGDSRVPTPPREGDNCAAQEVGDCKKAFTTNKAAQGRRLQMVATGRPGQLTRPWPLTPGPSSRTLFFFVSAKEQARGRRPKHPKFHPCECMSELLYPPNCYKVREPTPPTATAAAAQPLRPLGDPPARPARPTQPVPAPIAVQASAGSSGPGIKERREVINTPRPS